MAAGIRIEKGSNIFYFLWPFSLQLFATTLVAFVSSLAVNVLEVFGGREKGNGTSMLSLVVCFSNVYINLSSFVLHI